MTDIARLLGVKEEYLASIGCITEEECYNQMMADDEDSPIYKLESIKVLPAYDEDKERLKPNGEKRKRHKKKTFDKVEVKALTESHVSYEDAPNPMLLPTPFSYLLVAKPGSGKSTLLMNMLDWYKGYFDNIYIWSPTIYMDVSWGEFLSKNDDYVAKENVFKTYDESVLKTIMKKIEKHNKGKTSYKKKTKTLFIFDDIIVDLPRQQKGFINKMAFNHRHYGISHITISQEYVAVPPKMRKNTFGICLFGSDNGLERKKIIEELAGRVGRCIFEELWDEITSQRYSFLFIKPFESDIDKKFNKNFDYPINMTAIMKDECSDDEEEEEEEYEEDE